ncbi:MAG: polysaccharide deacetylase family protein [Clostridia bacterium]|nr:polysaccharide deacetylase family protein [Clostridia bacterium]
MKSIKKILTLALALVMMAQAVVIPALADTGDGEVTATYDAVIMDVKGGADAIATLTFDDGRDASVSKLVPLLEQYGLRASLMLVPTRVEGQSGTAYTTVAGLKSYLATGTVGIESHGYSHMYIAPEGTADYVEGNFTDANVKNETAGSLTYLNTKFPNEDVLTFAVPGSSYRDEAMDAVMDYFYAARRNTKGSSSVWQTLNPADNAEAGGWYNPYITWLTMKDEAGLNDRLAYLETCVINKGWFIAGAHDIADNPDSSLEDMTPATLSALLAKMKEYQDAGKLWVATYTDATKYVRERQNSTVTEYSTADGLFVKINMNEETENGLPLSTDVFDMPLTVRVEIPDGWTKVRFRQLQNGEIFETTVDSFVSGGKTFALVDVLPDGTAGYLTDGNAPIPSTAVNAEIAAAKGGANGIVSMTYDDGLYDTAELLNELFAEYGLEASLMLVTDKTNTSGGYTTAQWNKIFSEGYLEPQSHSSKHINVRTSTLDAAGLDEEIGGSYRDLVRDFPEYDHLTFAIPNSNYSKTELDVVNDYFYAARGGYCTLNSKLGIPQSLSPTFGTAAGSWYNPYMVRLQPNQPVYQSTNSTEQIISYLNKCATDGGWFISITHAVVTDDDPKANPTDGSEPADMTESQARLIFSSMQSLKESGKLWVTTYSEATKYVRERQNSTVTAYTTADGMYVELTMATETEDGLPLPADIFNLPLTVKIQVPSTWGKFTYTQGGQSTEVECFSEGGIKFAYIDLVPNGGPATLVNTGDPTGYVESLGMKHNVAADDSLTLNLYLPAESKVSGVYVGRTALAATPYGENMLVYSVGDINVTDINSEYKITLKFVSSTGYSDYVMTLSVISYFESLANSISVTAEEKQLAYNFLLFARASVVKFAAPNTMPDTSRADAVIQKLEAQGCTPASSTAAPSDLGTLTNVLTAADMAINEKPYYLFYIKEGFTGTLTVSYNDSTGTHTTEYAVVNGYYHCKNYVIFEVEGVYSLASELTIAATGKIGEADVTASGKYSMKNYSDGVGSDYVRQLYSWVLAADAYRN